MKVSELLKAALAKLGPNGEHWTKGAYARDSTGDITSKIEDAACFCGLGALRSVAFGQVRINVEDDNYRSLAYRRATALLEREVRHASFAVYQDQPDRTFDQVKSKFLEAIKPAEAQEQVTA